MQYMIPRYDTGHKGYHHQEEIADGVTGEWVEVPPMGMQGGVISCTIIAAANTGKVQFTTSSDAAVLADTAVAHDWDPGNVTGSKNDTYLGQLSAVRGVSISGAINFEVII